MTTNRLDILLYAHDGRGLGHASRTIGIGLALRRLYPSLKILFVSGCNMSQDLIGPAPLDWLKLPSYETTVEQGKSRGSKGQSNFEDKELGELRANQIRDIVSLYRPRLVYVDHSPQGKHRELLPALEACSTTDSKWILGMRGVMGQISKTSSSAVMAESVFQQYYNSILWFGDSKILGESQLHLIAKTFTTSPVECGYVSRLSELAFNLKTKRAASDLLTISVPWIGENTPQFLEYLYEVLQENKKHQVHLYLDAKDTQSRYFEKLFDQLPGCTVRPPGTGYVSSLLRSRRTVIFGGYNSLVDVLSLNIPSLVILREMKDTEQQLHLKALHSAADCLSSLPEICSKSQLDKKLSQLFAAQDNPPPKINFSGAQNGAKHLYTLLEH